IFLDLSVGIQAFYPENPGEPTRYKLASPALCPIPASEHESFWQDANACETNYREGDRPPRTNTPTTERVNRPARLYSLLFPLLCIRFAVGPVATLPHDRSIPKQDQCHLAPSNPIP